MGELIGGFIFVLAVLLSPKQCRDGWFVEGIRPNGMTQCRPKPPTRCGEPGPPDNQPCPQDDRVELRAIYCTGGTRPIVVDDRTVGCQR